MAFNLFNWDIEAEPNLAPLNLWPRRRPTQAPTYHDYILTNGHIPNINHMTLDIFFECEVEGCNNQTRNSCGFCLGCHPVQEVEDFPCSIERQRDPLMPRELNNIEFAQIPVNFPVFPMMDNLDEIVDEEHVNLDMPDIEVNINPPVMRREHAGFGGVPADR